MGNWIDLVNGLLTSIESTNKGTDGCATNHIDRNSFFFQRLREREEGRGGKEGEGMVVTTEREEMMNEPESLQDVTFLLHLHHQEQDQLQYLLESEPSD
jgi:hypothetical protein